MARKAMIMKNLKRQKTVEKYAAKRENLIKEGNRTALSKLPRDAFPSRVQNRCALTGRPHGYLRKFGISRIAFRELAYKGQIPGVRKASW